MPDMPDLERSGNSVKSLVQMFETQATQETKVSTNKSTSKIAVNSEVKPLSINYETVQEKITTPPESHPEILENHSYSPLTDLDKKYADMNQTFLDEFDELEQFVNNNEIDNEFSNAKNVLKNRSDEIQQLIDGDIEKIPTKDEKFTDIQTNLQREINDLDLPIDPTDHDSILSQYLDNVSELPNLTSEPSTLPISEQSVNPPSIEKQDILKTKNQLETPTDLVETTRNNSTEESKKSRFSSIIDKFKSFIGVIKKTVIAASKFFSKIETKASEEHFISEKKLEEGGKKLANGLDLLRSSVKESVDTAISNKLKRSSTSETSKNSTFSDDLSLSSDPSLSRNSSIDDSEASLSRNSSTDTNKNMDLISEKSTEKSQIQNHYQNLSGVKSEEVYINYLFNPKSEFKEMRKDFVLANGWLERIANDKGFKKFIGQMNEVFKQQDSSLNPEEKIEQKKIVLNLAMILVKQGKINKTDLNNLLSTSDANDEINEMIQQIKDTNIEIKQTKIDIVVANRSAIKSNNLSEQLTNLAQGKLKGIKKREFLRKLANDFSTLSAMAFKNINLDELEGLKWQKQPSETPNVDYMTKYFNKTSNFLQNQLLNTNSLHESARLYNSFVDIAYYLATSSNKKDYNTALAIFSCLNSASINRLKPKETDNNKSFIIHSKTEKKMQELNNLFSSESSYKEYRKQLRKDAEKNIATIPFMGMFMTDLVFTEEGNPNLIQDEAINLKKFNLLANTHNQIANMQGSLQNSEPVFNFDIPSQFAKYSLASDNELYAKSLALKPRRS